MKIEDLSVAFKIDHNSQLSDFLITEISKLYIYKKVSREIEGQSEIIIDVGCIKSFLCDREQRAAEESSFIDVTHMK